MALQLEKKKRVFLGEDFSSSDWNSIEPYYIKLLGQKVDTLPALEEWLRNRSELEEVLSEDMGWKYIRMTCDTTNKQYTDDFNHAITEIEPKIAPYSDKLNQKLVASPAFEALQKEEHRILKRGVKGAIELFREENIPLITEMQSKQQEFGALSAAMTVEIDGEEKTLQQAGVLLQNTDRTLREAVYRKISERRGKDAAKLDKLLSELIQLRHKIAQNAGFENYRDYMFKAMGRYDYSVEDCFTFHSSIAEVAKPLLEELGKDRKSKLGLDSLRPWDGGVDKLNRPPLKPFNGGADLLEKSLKCFNKIDPYLGECIDTLKEMQHLDLESRKGKSPGGYNYPLYETGVPFIFMNATSTVRDMTTMIHEGGHAVHSIVSRDLELVQYKDLPSEVAELASMSMELISMDAWDVFFDNEEELKRAKATQLEDIIFTLCWVATIDLYQHRLYEKPNHTVEERKTLWLECYEQFADGTIEWFGLEKVKENLWQKQLHIYEVPFYYIEYGMAQLGAVAVWKKVLENKEQGLKDYLHGLSLGYTKPIGEIYSAAGIAFDFSRDYIKELMDFVWSEWKKVQ